MLDTTKLNKEQLQAVIHPPHVPLQILAGPGSGKTRVLTSRIVYLIEHYGLNPSEICAVTFTNKAANEMKERLEKLIGTQRSTQLTLGTFHAICAKFLHEHGSSIGLSKNFTICDAETSKRIVGKIIKDHSLDQRFRGVVLKENEIVSQISQAKVKGLLPEDIHKGKDELKQQSMAMIYREYIATLKRNNCEIKCRSWCKHVLVDEFQDTNFIQYRLLVELASVNAGITIVGDPDQSIYGWRSADITNLHRMKEAFRDTFQILLEENFRSTMPILRFSLALISQDKTRVSKTLRTSHSQGVPPSLQEFASENDEAQFIAREIKRLSVYSDGPFLWKDFAVLLRFNALSRSIETAFQKEGVPYRMLAGVRFFDRLEIKDLVAYLQLVDNPSYFPAFQRACQTPPKGLGEKSLEQLSSKANATNQSVMSLATSIISGKTPDLKPPLKRKLTQLIIPLQKLDVMVKKGESVTTIIRELISLIGYESYLKKNQDWQTRWENVEELINFASQSEKDAEVSLHSASTSSQTPLRRFLTESMLSTHGENEAGDTELVTISTCHSAKGLEWPVVFIPAVEKNVFPFYRAENEEEERRLLYVACTRAQSYLHLTYAASRMAGERVSSGISPFLSKMDMSLVYSAPSTILKDDWDQNQSVGRDPPLFSNNKQFSTAKKILHENVDISLFTPAPGAMLVMPTTFSHHRSKAISSGSAENITRGKNCASAGKQMSLGNKRLGMGRSALGYCPNKKAKLS